MACNKNVRNDYFVGGSRLFRLHPLLSTRAVLGVMAVSCWKYRNPVVVLTKNQPYATKPVIRQSW